MKAELKDPIYNFKCFFLMLSLLLNFFLLYDCFGHAVLFWWNLTRPQACRVCEIIRFYAELYFLDM